ncbi:MAG: hypothetical protein R6X07_14675, partial [Desulfatiglandales bacterium]
MNKENQVAETVVEGIAEDVQVAEGGCVLEGTLEPCALVIIGASGDLTARKLVPSLFNLYRNKGLPKPFLIVGCGRTKMTDEAFRESTKDALVQNSRIDQGRWEAFAEGLYYCPIQYDEPSSYAELAERIQGLDKEHGTKGNRIFYLAIPPTLYETTARMIGKAGLSAEKDGWSRIVVEKPFGRDLKTAIVLDRVLGEHFQEHQIFRIDHYLAKETVQNILMLRFANAIFEPLWSRQYIDHVSITAAETLGVER